MTQTKNNIEINAAVFANSMRTPTGVVVFTCNGKTIGNAPLINGIATLIISRDKLGYGEHKILAHFAGNDKFKPSVSEATIKRVV